MPRHVILITLDRLAASQIGVFGSLHAQTPALDHLAARSLVFHNAFTQGVPTATAFSQVPQSTTTRLPGWAVEIHAIDVSQQHVTQTTDHTPREWVLSGVAAIRHQLISPDDGITWIKGAGIPDPWIPDHAKWEIDVSRRLGVNWAELLSDDESPLIPPELAVRQLASQGAFHRYEGRVRPELNSAVDRLGLALYSSCVERLDDRLGRLIREYQRHAHAGSLLIVSGLLGDTLPRQLPISRPVQLHHELVQVPLMIQVGAGLTGGATLLDLVQTSDIPRTIESWFDSPGLSQPLSCSPVSGEGATTDSTTRSTDGKCHSNRSAIDLLAVAAGTVNGHQQIDIESEWGELLHRTSEAQLVIAPGHGVEDIAEQREWLTLKPEDAWDLLNVVDQHPELRVSLRWPPP